ncbi:MAG: excinuclease ABC subunit UvrA [Deltaproteobacteria bacterium]|nr:excinuclease ABC subunit UvrA [Deltaproteobacteria bacterium]
MTEKNAIVIRGAREHNLKNIDVALPRDKLIVITGLSGSGKSSLAFDTLYAEGQRRYVESLSAYARQFLEQQSKPDVDSIEGLSPAISIEQKTTSRNPRSTVGTVTEIHDYLRLLFARIGRPFCYQCGKPIEAQTASQIIDRVMGLKEESRFAVLAPIVRDRKGEYRNELLKLRKDGYARVRVDGDVRDLSEDIKLDKNKKHTIDLFIDRLVLKPGMRQRVADAVELALKLGEGLGRIEVTGGESFLVSERHACIDCGISYPEITPRMFSFNNPAGACPGCHGLGETMFFDEALIVPDPTLSLADGAVDPWSGMWSSYHMSMLEVVSKHYKFRMDTPFNKLPKEARDVILHGSKGKEFNFKMASDTTSYQFTRDFEGVLPNLNRRYKETQSEGVREDLQKYMAHSPCNDCKGARLRPESLHVRVAGRAINEVEHLSIVEAEQFFGKLPLTPREEAIARMVLKEIRERLGFLNAVGLDYLSLDRAAGTLSGGEGQRIRLATQIGSALVGVLYVLDEPSIGLHQRDNERLLAMLRRLRDLGNTVVVVEHDADTILAADHVVDMGPGAGLRGGHVVAEGTPAEIMAHNDSLTGKYLAGKMRVEVPRTRRLGNGRALTVRNATGNNLKDVTVEFPLGKFVVVTGVSGSGKSTLTIDTLYQGLAHKLYNTRERPAPHKSIDGVDAVDKIIDIDQTPIGRTPRSNPATYTGIFGDIRDLFAELPDAKVRGYKPGRFSFNVKGGRCESCEGDGVLKIEMNFLPDVYVTCEQCHGKRYNPETLQVQYRGKSIADVLDLTATEAREFFQNIPALRRKLEMLDEVGLGYIHLGQQATTLSGGEAQRIKLAKELQKRPTGKTVYILDEPTTGLHFDDVARLLNVLHRFADAGNTVIVIEHNLDVIKTADWLIDMGPEGGARGGRVLAQGTPEQVARAADSHTGQFLRPLLEPPSRGRSARASASA